LSRIYREANDILETLSCCGLAFPSIRDEKEREAAKVDAWERYETLGDNASSGCPPYMERREHIYRRVGGGVS